MMTLRSEENVTVERRQDGWEIAGAVPRERRHRNHGADGMGESGGWANVKEI
jgi:hypothetical protein